MPLRKDVEPRLEAVKNEPESLVSNPEVISKLELQLGEIIQIEEISGGLLHYVFKVVGSKRIAYVKIRGNTFAKLPDIKTVPQNIKYEYRALNILYNLEPETFPQPLLFDEDRALIAMSDVIPNGRTFQQEFQENTISENDMLELGTTVGRVHTKLGPYQQPIRDNGDQVNYLKDLTHRFGYQNHPIINEVISELEKNPSQLILADLSPKNIGRGSHRQITICDFDSFFLGNPLYPLAFLTGHVLVHSLDSSRKSEALVYALLSGLKQEFPNGDYDSDLYIKTTLSSVLYRLRNPKINYPVPLSEQERLQKATTGFQLLFKNSISWEDVFREMTVWV